MNMLKFCYYTVLNYEKVEHFLSEMESKGYILVDKTFLYIFKFKNTTPKKANYFLTFSPSGGSFSMYGLEKRLKSECGANKIIKNKFQSPGIYRICDTDKKMYRFKKMRNLLLRTMCINQSIFAFIAFLFFEFTFFVAKNCFIKNYLLHLILTIPILAFSVYNLICFFVLKNKNLELKIDNSN